MILIDYDLYFNASFQVHPGYVDTSMTSHKGPLTIDQGKYQFIHGEAINDIWCR